LQIIFIRNGKAFYEKEIWGVFMWESVWKILMVTNFFLAGGIVFFQRRDPRTVWAWLLVLYFLPWVGFALYFLVGRDYYRDRRFRTKELREQLHIEACRQEDALLRHSLMKSETECCHDLIMYNLRTGYAAYSDDNEICIYTDGGAKFEALLKEIDGAKAFIFLQYYIIRDDVLFARICRHLRKKVKEGVEVRIFFDGIGGSSVPKRAWRELEGEGIEVCEFLPLVLKKVHIRANYRNHRKIAVIDGKVGFVGGFNIGEEYLGRNKKFGYWRDTHLKITGSAVKGLLVRFVLDWNYASGKKLVTEDYIRDCKGKGSAGIQIVTSGPDAGYEQIRDNYLRLINKAEKSIYIQTPYFVPDEAVFNALKIAAYSGLDVRLMIPCKPDHPFVYWATYSFVGDLLKAGVRCYLYNNGFLHAKAVMIDKAMASVGTANMDIRSFKLNFEVNAIIYDMSVVAELENLFFEDVGKSRELTLYDYESRRFGIRIKEQVSRLLAPLL